LLGFSSPLSPFITGLVVKIINTKVSRQNPNISFACRRAGLSWLLNKFHLSELQIIENGKTDIKIKHFTVAPRIFPSVIGKISLRKVTINTVSITAQVPIPAASAKEKKQAIPDLHYFDFKRMPSISAANIHVALLLISSNAPPVPITLHDLAIGASYGTKKGVNKSIYEISLSSIMQINNGSNVTIKIKSELDEIQPDFKSTDIDASIETSEITLADLNPVISPYSPFSIMTGQMKIAIDMRARKNVLSGLCSIKINNMDIEQNNSSRSGTFLSLSFNAWKFLIKNNKGDILLDCDITGTVDHPVIPISSVLSDMAGTAGRNVFTRILNAIPTTTTKEAADKMESNAAIRAKYDNVLKINRLPPEEQHLARGLHFEKIVKNYEIALEEYSLQLQEYPAETNNAVQALMASAEIKNKHKKDTNGAVSDLRKIIEKYKTSPYVDDALYRIIQLFVEAKMYPDANSSCEEFTSTFPNSEYISKVKQIKKDISRYVW